MHRPLVALALAGTVFAVPPAPAAALTVEAFAGITFRLLRDADGPALTTVLIDSLPATQVEDASGDATAEITRTPVVPSGTGGALGGVEDYFVSRRINAVVTADENGEGAASGTTRIEFIVARSLTADGFIDLELSALPGLGGQIVNVFGQANRANDSGSAFGRITLERNDFEGTLFDSSAFVNLVGLGPGDFNADARFLATPFVLQNVLIPQREVGDPDVRFTLDIFVQTLGFAEPLGDPNGNGNGDGQNGEAVIPVPPAAPLLALGLAALAALRRTRDRTRRPA